MTPIRLEAVYERLPLGIDAEGPASVRWGVRAFWGDDPGIEGLGPVDAQLGRRAPRSVPEDQQEPLRARRSAPRGPRELTPQESPTLRYTARGRAVPLAGPGLTNGFGQYLDVTA